MAVLVDAQGEMLDNIESQVIWYFFYNRVVTFQKLSSLKIKAL